jgi:release factor glutamine methyltransferase
MNNNTKEDLWLLHEKYEGKECPEFFEDLRRIESGEPVDYVIGFSMFLGAKIDLEHHPMIPRQETEWWVEKALNIITGSGLHPEPKRLKILDLFAGSGCIGIALLKNLPDVLVDFGEKDPLLIKQIEKNLEINNIPIAGRGSLTPSETFRSVTIRACVYESDVFQNIPPNKYDFIFANPPYISHDRKWQVAKPVLEHEPHLALFTQDDGLFFVKKLLNEAPTFLAENGKLFMEFDQWQKETIEELVAESKFQGEFWKDQNEKWRVVMCELK